MSISSKTTTTKSQFLCNQKREQMVFQMPQLNLT